MSLTWELNLSDSLSLSLYEAKKKKETNETCMCSVQQDEEKGLTLDEKELLFFGLVKLQKQVFQWNRA